MKKLLVLSLILGIASLATAGTDLGAVAGLSYSVEGQSVTVTADAATNGYLINLHPDDGVAVSNVVVSPAFTTYASPGAWYASYGGVQMGISASVTNAVTGTILTFDVGAGTQSVDLIATWAGSPGMSFEAGSVDIAGYTITIPEPATMAILSLGGLFLARRKK